MRKFSGEILIGAVALALAGWAAPAAAQTADAVSRPVVQPLPPQGASDLSDALQRLARDSRDLDALIDAGTAALELNDIDAAIGFFGRAQELSPQNPRIKLGLAGAYVRSERPLDALRLFDEAVQAGASTGVFAAERGLAYDLVGDNAAAQAQYRQALSTNADDDETVRRLAISQAISGDREAFEKTLYPQLESEDFAGFRTRAFGLAILGDEEEAVAIAEAVMPRELSARISPYLRYMGRLTKAQQAAAVNLGMFPRAAQIGRDDPRIAQYAGNAPGTRELDARLAPTGEALGASAAQAEVPTPEPRRVASASAQPFDQRTRIIPDAQRNPSRNGATVQPIPADTTPSPTSGTAGASAELAAISQPVVQPVPEPSPAETPAQGGAELPPATAASATGSAQPTRIAMSEPAAATPAPAAQPTPEPEIAIVETSVADAFAGFTLAPSNPGTRSANAVDITTIQPRREVAEKPPEKPAPPAHPKRFWVQVATGKNLEAFRWDWRRISRKAPEVLGDFEPMTTPWVEANRLLAGPFATEKAANDAVGKLREAGLDSFPFTSEEGEEIVPLG